MAAIADLSAIVNRATGGNSGTPETIFFSKNGRVGGAVATTPIAGRPASLWTYDGFPGPGAAPGAVAVPTNATAGGLLQADPGGSRQKWLLQAFATGLNGGTLILYDRLLHISGLSGTTTTAQSVGGTLTRYTNGQGNIVFIEIYTIIGTTGTTVTMQYTDQAGNSPQVGPAVTIGGTGFREVTRALFLPVSSGDSGVRGVTDIDLLASTGTAGDIGVTVAHPLAFIEIGAAGAAGWRDFATGMPGLPEILTDACLAFVWVPNSAAVPEIFGAISSVEV